ARRRPEWRPGSSPDRTPARPRAAARSLARHDLSTEQRELLIGFGADADLVAASEAGVAEVRGVRPRGLQHPVQRKVAEGIGGEIAPEWRMPCFGSMNVRPT